MDDAKGFLWTVPLTKVGGFSHAEGPLGIDQPLACPLV